MEQQRPINNRQSIPLDTPKSKANMSIDSLVTSQTSRLIQAVGYIVLGLSFIEYLLFFIPPQFFNPNWEFTTMGKMIELIWAPLLGFAFIFYRPQGSSISLWEKRFLSVLSWLALLIGIVYLLMIPLLTVNGFRINRNLTAQYNTQLTAQTDQVAQIKQQIEQAKDEDLKRLLSQANPQIEVNSPEIKQDLITSLEAQQEQAKAQSEAVLKQQQKNLLKNGAKFGIGAILSVVAFFMIWSYSRWTRFPL